jgi:hypothetical protein
MKIILFSAITLALLTGAASTANSLERCIETSGIYTDSEIRSCTKWCNRSSRPPRGTTDDALQNPRMH